MKAIAIIFMLGLLVSCTRVVYYPIPVDMTFILEGYKGIEVSGVSGVVVEKSIGE